MTYAVFLSGELETSTDQIRFTKIMPPFVIDVLEPGFMIDNSAPYFNEPLPTILLSPGVGVTVSLGGLVDAESN